MGMLILVISVFERPIDNVEIILTSNVYFEE